ncbi:hypothetical protein SAMN05421812_104124 [Asanoa hainanensis]|uniref:DUF7144 domain-containing protein n=1 Tax=Asanoa hainanensis TaxID=560556 RepID=A0A239L8C9_9ACTN|nr:hypothetical protein [Asanoa hainanensis]SNT26866.1 hypothetical protein SAMN05421812_104124 [Asanoa hainanensis]
MTRDTSSRQLWAASGAIFAAVVLLMMGLWQLVMGIVAVVRGSFFVVTQNYLYSFSTTGWGILHIVLGALAALAGLALFTGATWARALGIFFAVLSATANFFFIPYYPFWALLEIAMAVFVIWALAVWKPREVGMHSMRDDTGDLPRTGTAPMR